MKKIIIIFWAVCLRAIFSSAQPGALDISFNPGTGANNIINASLIQADGKILIGGDFSFYNGTFKSGIARINTEGSLDTSFNTGTGVSGSFDQVNSLALQNDGKVIIGGYFTSYNGRAANYIARLNPDGTLDSSFNTGSGADNAIATILIQPDGKIIIGGLFTYFNGVVKNNIARLNSDGSIDNSFNSGNGTNGTIFTSALQTDGKIIIAGDFTSYNDTTKKHITRLDINGILDTTFNIGPGADGNIWTSLLQPDGKILIGGAFTHYNKIFRNHIARISSNGNVDTSFTPGTGADAEISSFAVQKDGKIIIGGVFTFYNGIARNQIARLNSNGILDNSFDPGSGANNFVNSIQIQNDGKIIIVGWFTSYNGTAINRIARLMDSPTNINDFNNEKNLVILYPNPTNNIINFLFPRDMEEGELVIYNIFGEKVNTWNQIKGRTLQIEINIPKGTYFVNIVDSKSKWSQKFLIQ